MTVAARVPGCPLGPEEQQLRLARLEAITRERTLLETTLLLLDAEEAGLLAACEHSGEDGEPFTDPLCPICEAALV